MRIMKTAIPSDDGSHRVCDTIQHDGKLWLAPAWLDESAKAYRRPARLIGMNGLKYRSMPMGGNVDFVMEHPVPDAILQGRVQGAEAEPFTVLERPDVRVVKQALTTLVEPSAIDLG